MTFVLSEEKIWSALNINPLFNKRSQNRACLDIQIGPILTGQPGGPSGQRSYLDATYIHCFQTSNIKFYWAVLLHQGCELSW
jgi:hypothetical protein